MKRSGQRGRFASARAPRQAWARTADHAKMRLPGTSCAMRSGPRGVPRILTDAGQVHVSPLPRRPYRKSPRAQPPPRRGLRRRARSARPRQSLRDHARQRHEADRQGRPPRALGGAHGVVPRRRDGRARRRLGCRPRARAHDVQGYQGGRPGRVQQARGRRRRTRQRLHRQGLHRLLPAGAAGAAAGDDGARGRPHEEPRAHRRGVRARDRGGQGRTPPAHRRPAARAGVRAADGHRLPGPPLSPPGDRLDARPRGHAAGGCARVVPALVRAQ